MLRLIFIMPVLQLLIFGYVVNTDVKRLGLTVYDFDQSVTSRDLVSSLSAGDYFIPEPATGALWDQERRFRDGSDELALVIPEDFSERLTERRPVTIGLIADGTDANAITIGLGYMAQMTRRFSEKELKLTLPLTVRRTVRYNPEAESVYFMVPGIVAALLTMITVMLTSMAIVRERERGTLEQLMVTPINPATLLAGKLIPFALLGLAEMTIALTLGVFWFGIPFVGSPVLLFCLALLYLINTLAIGLLFSTVTSTQQQAMFFAWFFAVFAMLTSGFFTPIANMPHWLQIITHINPMRYFMAIVRGIMMKGASLVDLRQQVWPLVLMGTVLFSVAALRFTKRAR